MEGEVTQTSANGNLNQLLGAHSFGDPVGPSGLEACTEIELYQDPVTSHLVDQHEISTRDKEGFQCFDCEKVFPSKWKLKRHRRIHTGEKPFACGLCPYRASQKPVLQAHMRRHTGEKFYCPCCPFHCSQRITMRKHMSKYNHGSDF